MNDPETLILSEMASGFRGIVPAVMGNRVIESRPARLLTIMLTPFVPCSAGLMIISSLLCGILGYQLAVWLWAGGGSA